MLGGKHPCRGSLAKAASLPGRLCCAALCKPRHREAGDGAGFVLECSQAVIARTDELNLKRVPTALSLEHRSNC